MHHETRHVLGREQQVGTEWRGQCADGNVATHHAVARYEMPQFVELAVVGQMHLGHNTQQPAAMDRERAVVQRAGMAQRRANQQHGQQISRSYHELSDNLPPPHRAARSGAADR